MDNLCDVCTFSFMASPWSVGGLPHDTPKSEENLIINISLGLSIPQRMKNSYLCNVKQQRFS